MSRTWIAFGGGVAVALAAGWLAFPRALYQREPQPFAFPHRMHAQKSGTSACGDCHTLRADGEFAGIPATQSCAACHADKMGKSAAEAVLVDRFVKPGHEAPWLVNAQQPANVRFSHAIHTKLAGLKCAECHGTLGQSDAQPVYERNRISGYASHVVKMSACEDCHARRGVNAGCLGCHQ